MNRRIFLFGSATSFLRAAKKSQAKGPEVALLEHSGKVDNGNVVIDGRVKNISEKPFRVLTVIYEILDSDRNVLTRQRGELEQQPLAPGEEAGFSVQMVYHARAISYRLSFEDAGERELRAEKTGPFPIE